MKKLIYYFLTTTTLAVTFLVTNMMKVDSKPLGINLKFDTKTQTIQGSTGGPINSKGCGYIASSPNHVINIPKRVDYMRLTVQASGGQPTLLVRGPSSKDSFCVLGDAVSGFKPEMSGVWEPGEYKIYIGDLTGKNHRFTLNISTK
ncbi:MAG: hypothetical protein QNJ41_02295 [Xenococcaceae cyanobacterium MO_188.B32]|nr:hypothetical protein [Xenococcaceae cyanobacterium MO_188.B32]